MKKFFKHIWWLALVIVLAIGLDAALSYLAPVEKSDIFLPNDYERAVQTNDNKTQYDKVFFGNSVVISAYLEEESSSDYVNFGLVYGTVKDLYTMLEKDLLTVNDELVIGLNYLTLLDTLETNPTYPWHRKFYQPYLYFQRDRISPVITEGFTNVMNGEAFISRRYTDLERPRSYTILSDAELDDKIASYEELYWHQGIEAYRQNLEALDKLAAYCKENNIRLRAVWMPWNDYCPMPSIITEVTAKANVILDKYGIETLDLIDALDRGDFQDLGHLYYNSEDKNVGAFRFTKEIDPWLKQ